MELPFRILDPGTTDALKRVCAEPPPAAPAPPVGAGTPPTWWPSPRAARPRTAPADSRSHREALGEREGGHRPRRRGSFVPYAGPIHFGWRKRHFRPQPFLFRAAGQKQDGSWKENCCPSSFPLISTSWRSPKSRPPKTSSMRPSSRWPAPPRRQDRRRGPAGPGGARRWSRRSGVGEAGAEPVWCYVGSCVTAAGAVRGWWRCDTSACDMSCWAARPETCSCFAVGTVVVLRRRVREPGAFGAAGPLGALGDIPKPRDSTIGLGCTQDSSTGRILGVGSRR